MNSPDELSPVIDLVVGAKVKDDTAIDFALELIETLVDAETRQRVADSLVR